MAYFFDTPTNSNHIILVLDGTRVGVERYRLVSFALYNNYIFFFPDSKYKKMLPLSSEH